MRFFSLTSAVLLAYAFLSSAVHAASNSTSKTSSTGGVIIVRGNKLYNAATGERFMIKGMTYEYVVSDEYYEKYSKAVIDKHLADVDMNTLRLYDINPDLSYKKFMDDMAKRGVYVVVGATPDGSEFFGKYRYGPLRKDLGPEEGEYTCYPGLLLEYGKKIAKNFAQFDNTLGMLIGNEIMQKDLTPGACVKQYAADLKGWMRSNSKTMRILPLLYAAADSAYGSKIPSPDEYHTLKIQGLLCGDKMEDGMMTRSIDVYLINEYRWCQGMDFAVYQNFLSMAQGIPIVIGFGEYGCNIRSKGPREWEMVPYFYDAPSATKGFSDVFSGGFAYSFGQAKLAPDATFPMFTGGSTNPLGQPSNEPTPDFENLKKQFAAHPAYSDPAKWDKDNKCEWVPELTTKVSATNKRASASGWIVADCKADALKVVESDTWITRTREGLGCNKGDPCYVTVPEAVGTTQEDICGKAFVASQPPADTAPQGGGTCKAASDCSGHGECVEVKKVKQCKCAACYGGTDCSVKDTLACPSDKGTAVETSKPSSFAVGLPFMSALVVSAAMALAI